MHCIYFVNIVDMKMRKNYRDTYAGRLDNFPSTTVGQPCNAFLSIKYDF